MNETYRGGNKLILGIVLGVITFWLFVSLCLIYENYLTL
ncbi:antibiotic resistance-related transmembrane efflux protein [Staphylococcus aureus]|nr:antibiotic resistance-related transmembrane efflux protein [Staphylococcus aureus]SGW84597.1 antibiotic resistance-related transmembrane efflux protein [Staphylococcus aureus]SHB88720.1 antibiotic resistance-related transmembrane efflux protein [Staphylococcus aureus]